LESTSRRGEGAIGFLGPVKAVLRLDNEGEDGVKGSREGPGPILLDELIVHVENGEDSIRLVADVYKPWRWVEIHAKVSVIALNTVQ